MNQNVYPDIVYIVTYLCVQDPMGEDGPQIYIDQPEPSYTGPILEKQRPLLAPSQSDSTIDTQANINRVSVYFISSESLK